MILDIKPIHEEVNSCLDDVVITILNWLNLEYRLIYADSWRFFFNKSQKDNHNNLLGRMITLHTNSFLKLEAYYGIKFVHHYPRRSWGTKIFSILQRELSLNKPIVLSMDVFYCPWSPLFKKDHGWGPHQCLAVGFDKDYIYCLDPFYSNCVNKLTYPDFYDGVTQSCFSLSIKKKPSPKINKDDILKNTRQMIDKLTKNDDMFEAIRDFGKAIEKWPFLEREAQGCEDINGALLIGNLLTVSKERLKFVMFLNYFSELHEDLIPKSVIDDLRTIASKWATIRGVLIKGFLYGNVSSIQLKVADKINALAVHEENTANKLRELLKGSSFTNKQIHKATNLNMINAREDYVFVDLTRYLNNEGCGTSLSNTCSADLNGNHEYYIMPQNPKCELWEPGGIKFKFPVVIDGINDNISCSGQIINIPVYNCQSIMILGCEEFGYYYEKIHIKYQDGTLESVPVELTDWVLEPRYGEVTAWEGRSAVRTNGEANYMNMTVRLFAKKLLLDHQGAIDSIILPECSNIHIFAITLGVQKNE